MADPMIRLRKADEKFLVCIILLFELQCKAILILTGVLYRLLRGL